MLSECQPVSFVAGVGVAWEALGVCSQQEILKRVSRCCGGWFIYDLVYKLLDFTRSLDYINFG